MGESQNVLEVQMRPVPPPNSHQVVLDFISAFAGAQSWVDLVMEPYLTNENAKPWASCSRSIATPPDEGRGKFAHALAKEIDYSGRMQTFSQTYRRDAGICNRTAYHGVIWPTWEPGSPADGSGDYYGILGNGMASATKVNLPTYRAGDGGAARQRLQVAGGTPSAHALRDGSSRDR
jgi:hypothetical protein